MGAAIELSTAQLGRITSLYTDKMLSSVRGQASPHICQRLRRWRKKVRPKLSKQAINIWHCRNPEEHARTHIILIGIPFSHDINRSQPIDI